MITGKELKICNNCAYFKPDYGIWCFNGWTDRGERGWCRLEPKHVKVDYYNFCRHFINEKGN